MKQWIIDTAGLGTALWLIGYLASLVLFYTPYAGIMGWILIAIFTPVTIVIAWWWFGKREPLPLQYYARVGIAWMLIAVLLDYLFIVLLFQASYYEPDVVVYLYCHVPHPGWSRPLPEPYPERAGVAAGITRILLRG